MMKIIYFAFLISLIQICPVWKQDRFVVDASKGLDGELYWKEYENIVFSTSRKTLRAAQTLNLLHKIVEGFKEENSNTLTTRGVREYLDELNMLIELSNVTEEKCKPKIYAYVDHFEPIKKKYKNQPNLKNYIKHYYWEQGEVCSEVLHKKWAPY